MLQSSTEAQQMYLFDVISQLHPELYGGFGVELFNLQNANGPGRLWNHPALDLPSPAPPPTPSPPPTSIPVPASPDDRNGQPQTVVDSRAAIMDELRVIETSRAWMLVQQMKANSLYRTIARARWGADWEQAPEAEDPCLRLERIKNSRSFRIIQAVKSSPMYRWYARKKHGPGGSP
jgi:hypothetical protein